VFISPSKFRMPEDGNVPMIMVGPGHRHRAVPRLSPGAQGARRTRQILALLRSQKERCDYFYRDEFDQLQSEGYLTKMSCAFSRDQEHKIYVQHRMLENAAELWKWIDSEGAPLLRLRRRETNGQRRRRCAQ
jgi:sulfite reductase alpha subunit-like flavoprotein